jgi:HlyD family secretion protein
MVYEDESEMTVQDPSRIRPRFGASWRGMRRFALWLALALASVAALLAVWRAWSQRSEAATPAFETRLIGRGLVERSISATGSVKALVTVEVGSQLSGMIAEMKVDFNDPVKEGDLLAVIDRAPYEAKVASAAANLAIARADIGEKEAAVTKAATQLAQNKRDLIRHESLAPRGISSALQREQAETQTGLGKSDLAIAHAQLESAKATISLREADLAQAEIDLGHTLIRSPINGVVIDRRFQPGQTVAAQYQTPILFQIAQDLSQILIFAQVDEADIGPVRPGAPVTFTVEAYPDETFVGVVDQVRLAATKTAGVITYTVIIRAQNPDQRLFPDMTATVRIVSARREDALYAHNEALRFRPPASAVGQEVDLEEGQGDRVFTPTPDEDGKLQRRPVRLGLKGDGVSEIIDGEVEEGEPVAIRAKSAGQRRP